MCPCAGDVTSRATGLLVLKEEQLHTGWEGAMRHGKAPRLSYTDFKKVIKQMVTWSDRSL